jgi:DNA-binding transcriptional LysR family regulator
MGKAKQIGGSVNWLNYHHLLYFWTVARDGSIAKASVTLRLSSPTISQQIRNLEESLDAKLFEKQGRKFVLLRLAVSRSSTLRKFLAVARN